MTIPKAQILQLLRDRDDDQAAAEKYLPAQVDPEQHGNLLGSLGLDREETERSTGR